VIVNHTFRLNDERIAQLEGAGLSSLRDLAKVLRALDLRAVVQIEEIEVRSKTPLAEGQP
jgi:hypothetical protein